MTVVRNNPLRIFLFILTLFSLQSRTYCSYQINSCQSNESSSGSCNGESQSISTIVVFGRTGVGKSALCNQIAGSKVFVEGETLTSETSNSISHIVQWPQDSSKRIRLVDTPGFGDNRASQKNEDLLANILSFLKELKGGFNIGIFCIRANTRIDAHDIEELTMIGMLLGNSVFKHTFIAITQTNTLVPEQREKNFSLYTKELPQILANNGMPWFTKDKILFADFSQFDELFLNPLANILQSSTAFVPTLPTDIDPNNPETIKTYFQDPEMQAWIKKQKQQAEELEMRKLITELSERQLSLENMINEKNNKKQQLINNREHSSITYNQEKVTIERRIQEIRYELDQVQSSYNNQNAQTQLRIQQLNQELNQKLMTHQDLVLQQKELEQLREEIRNRLHHHHPNGHHGYHRNQRHRGGFQKWQELNVQIQQSSNQYENQKIYNQNEINNLNTQLGYTLNNLSQKQTQSDQQIRELNSQLQNKLNQFNQLSQQTQNEINGIDHQIMELNTERNRISKEIEEKRMNLKKYE